VRVDGVFPRVRGTAEGLEWCLALHRSHMSPDTNIKLLYPEGLNLMNTLLIAYFA
jgi:hypothetical protein